MFVLKAWFFPRKELHSIRFLRVSSLLILYKYRGIVSSIVSHFFIVFRLLKHISQALLNKIPIFCNALLVDLLQW